MADDVPPEASTAFAAAQADGREIAQRPASTRERDQDDRKNNGLFSAREVFDRIGYGAITPQFINILLYLSAAANPFILFLVGLLNGLKATIGILASSLLQEYQQMHKVSKRAISLNGIVFGFSFLLMAFGLLLRNLWVFSIAFLIGAFGIASYGDLYRQFLRGTLRRERRGAFLRSISHWGVLITALALLASGLLLDLYPMEGVAVMVSLFGETFAMRAYGYLFSFEIAALAFIISGYLTYLVIDTREERTYPLARFLGEHLRILRSQFRIFSERKILFLAIAGVISGLLQILIAAYSGIAIYRIIDARYAWPFLVLAIVYAIAIIASFTGPYFTGRLHRSLGLAPMMVFASLLMAILPLVLVYNANIAAITAALATYVIGGAILGFAQGMLAQRLMDSDTRRSYYRAQAYIAAIPYLVLVPILAWIANALPLAITFLIVAVGMVVVVMPLYFYLVVRGQRT